MCIANDLYFLYSLSKYLVASLFTYNSSACTAQINLVAKKRESPRTLKKTLKKIFKRCSYIRTKKRDGFVIKRTCKICGKGFILEITVRFNKTCWRCILDMYEYIINMCRISIFLVVESWHWLNRFFVHL